MRLYQKIIEIYRKKKIRKLVYKKEILQQVEVGFNKKKKKMIQYLHVPFFFYGKRIADDAFCIFFFFLILQ